MSGMSNLSTRLGSNDCCFLMNRSVDRFLLQMAHKNTCLSFLSAESTAEAEARRALQEKKRRLAAKIQDESKPDIKIAPLTSLQLANFQEAKTARELFEMKRRVAALRAANLHKKNGMPSEPVRSENEAKLRNAINKIKMQHELDRQVGMERAKTRREETKTTVPSFTHHQEVVDGGMSSDAFTTLAFMVVVFAFFYALVLKSSAH